MHPLLMICLVLGCKVVCPLVRMVRCERARLGALVQTGRWSVARAPCMANLPRTVHLVVHLDNLRHLNMFSTKHRRNNTRTCRYNATYLAAVAWTTCQSSPPT